MKKKTITLVVYMLVCISLVSVGFAAWMITGGEQEQAQGNITATTVTDYSITIDDFKWDKLDQETNERSLVAATKLEADGSIIYKGGSISFGRPYQNYNNDWFQGDPEDELEKTYAILTFKVSSESKLSEAIAKLDTFTIDILESAAITSAQTAKLIADEKIYVKSAASADDLFSVEYNENDDLYTEDDLYTAAKFKSLLNIEAKEIYIGVKIVYNWGSEFGGVNPVTFYNSYEPTDSCNSDEGFKTSTYAGNDTVTTMKDHAKKAINDLYTYLYGNDKTSDGIFNIKIVVDKTN